MTKKISQTSLEFLILVTTLLFFFSIFFIFIQVSMSDRTKQKEDIALKEIALTVQNEINLAFQSSEGYNREFKIPNDLNGKDYNLTIVENMVYIKTNDGKNAIALPIQKINGQIYKNINKISKINGQVNLNV